MKERIIDFWESGKIQAFINENREVLIKVAAAALLVVAAFFVFVFTSEEEESLAEENNVVTETESQVVMIMVDVGGEVNDPKVVELEEGSRVEDAINAAGGVTENADLMDINRAAFLEDGDKILIPKKTDESTSDVSGSSSQQSSSKGGYSSYFGKININTAGSEELQQLDGVGPATAEKIIEYRETAGRFKNIEDIKNVSGIGDKTFEKMKENICT